MLLRVYLLPSKQYSNIDVTRLCHGAFDCPDSPGNLADANTNSQVNMADRVKHEIVSSAADEGFCPFALVLA